MEKPIALSGRHTWGNSNGPGDVQTHFGPSMCEPVHNLTLEEIIRDVVVPCGKPIFTGLRCGHCTPNLTLPLGVKCRMNADECTLTVLESAVKE